METNTCDVNHLDADALLPPRKRLLAGLKRQNSDINSPAPSTSRSGAGEYNAHLNHLLMSNLNNPNLSNEEIIEASKCAAMKAAKVAETARANAEEKAAKAAKAVAAAKSALDLVTIISEEATKKDKYQKKNKIKHLPVQVLYNKNKGIGNSRTDEELARKLHQSINSSPRILKSSPGSDSKNNKNKKMKTSSISGKTSIHSASPSKEGNQLSTAISNGNRVAQVSVEGPVKGIDMIMVDLNTSRGHIHDELRRDKEEGWLLSKTDQKNTENGEVGASSNDKFSESLDSFSKKRGRIKQKKLPLSICSFRDQTSPKEELKSLGMPQSDDRNTPGNEPFFSVEASSNSLLPVERKSMWKCQSFKVPACVAQNKVMQS